MKTVAKETVAEFEEKKSKFICYIKPVSTVEEAKEFIEKINKKHPDATHNIPVYKVIENGQEYLKFSDDGEPKNTAGKPAAEVVNMLDVYNVVLVISRYFGGIKLGAGGLIRNYAKSAKLGIQEAGIVEYRESFEVIIDFSYAKASEVDRYMQDKNIEVIDKKYEERVSYRLRLYEEDLNYFREENDILLIEC